MDIFKALKEAESWMDTIEGVEGVAEGKSDGRPCITVFISLEDAKTKIPESLHGFKVVCDVSGGFSAL